MYSHHLNKQTFLFCWKLTELNAMEIVAIYCRVIYDLWNFYSKDTTEWREIYALNWKSILELVSLESFCETFEPLLVKYFFREKVTIQWNVLGFCMEMNKRSRGKKVCDQKVRWTAFI